MNDPEIITDVDPRGFSPGEFPSSVAYPLEACVDPANVNVEGSGASRQSGHVWTDWNDYRKGRIRLETIWHPLWDLAPVYSLGPPRLTFFQRDGGGHPANGDYSGQRGTNYFLHPYLAWPKRFHLWEISFDAPASDVLERARVWCHIGEKNYLSVPFASLLHRTAAPGQIRRFIPLCQPLYFPPVQNWTVFLEWSPTEREVPPLPMTCVLGGYLHREIC